MGLSSIQSPRSILFRPATGELRATPVQFAPNAVLHPWLQQELTAILATCPPPGDPAPGQRWCDWQVEGPSPPRAVAALLLLRLLLVWDNLAGHHTPNMVQWCLERGILPLYTPIAGSRLNMVESRCSASLCGGHWMASTPTRPSR